MRQIVTLVSFFCILLGNIFLVAGANATSCIADPVAGYVYVNKFDHVFLGKAIKSGTYTDQEGRVKSYTDFEVIKDYKFFILIGQKRISNITVDRGAQGLVAAYSLNDDLSADIVCGSSFFSDKRQISKLNQYYYTVLILIGAISLVLLVLVVRRTNKNQR